MGKKRTSGSVVGFILLFVALLIGVSLLPTFADEAIGAQYKDGNTTFPTNVTGAAQTITGLLTLFFALVILLAAVKWGLQKR